MASARPARPAGAGLPGSTARPSQAGSRQPVAPRGQAGPARRAAAGAQRGRGLRRTLRAAGPVPRRRHSRHHRSPGRTVMTIAADTSTLRDEIAARLISARARTHGLTDCVDEADLIRQHSPLMSPLVWDLAHVANQEELWLLRGVGGREPIHPEIDPLYDAFEHPRAKRPTLPLLPPAQARGYASDVRGRVLDLLERVSFTTGPLVDQGFVFGMIAQHEQQHDETMLATHQLRRGSPVLTAPPPGPAPADVLGLPA